MKAGLIAIINADKKDHITQINNTFFLPITSEICQRIGAAKKAAKAYPVIPYEIKCADTQ